MPETDYAKAEYFRQYKKACLMADFHRNYRTRHHHQGLAAISADFYEARARSLAGEHPEFPEAMRTYFPNKAHTAIDE